MRIALDSVFGILTSGLDSASSGERTRNSLNPPCAKVCAVARRGSNDESVGSAQHPSA
ncbi:MAG: hypothetical protein G01um101438_1011 [Parcubacteria group bacterium Gr01-1014_38]|nr:MAG: hypothetical protein G01um101438_1011 [Parcubacteria group bacterium Gr01-1014_38]